MIHSLSNFLLSLPQFPGNYIYILNGNSNAYPIYHAQSKEAANQLLIECKQTVNLKRIQINPGDPDKIFCCFLKKKTAQGQKYKKKLCVYTSTKIFLLGHKLL